MNYLFIMLFSVVLILAGCQESTPEHTHIENAHSSSDVNVRQSHVLYVDVRTQEERDQGHISGAVHLPLAEIEKGNTEILPKDQELIIYCRSGNRSNQAIQILQKQGFTELTNGGGIADIQGAPIVSSQ